LRARLLISCLVPVLLLAAGGFLLLAGAGRQTEWLRPGEALVLFAGCVLFALLLAAGLALNLGDRIARPVVWLLRMMESGQLRLMSQAPPPASDREMDALTGRVQVLLRQNLSGARAMQELESLRGEIGAILEAAGAGRFDPAGWRTEQATHPLTRRLLDYYRQREESLHNAADDLTRLQGLIEQDWREETLVVEEIARRSERCFLEQTEMALELERLEKQVRPSGANGIADGETAREETAQVLHDLRGSLQRWRRELEAALGSGAGTSDLADLPGRLRAWDAWVDESLSLFEGSLNTGGAGNGNRLSPRLERAARAASKAGQEIGALSCEAAQLQRNWARLGERLRSLLARVGEVHPGSAAAPQGREDRDGLE
jgi:hypothetical protein